MAPTLQIFGFVSRFLYGGWQEWKVANELTERREERPINQRQYQKENIKNGLADHITQERLAN